MRSPLLFAGVAVALLIAACATGDDAIDNDLSGLSVDSGASTSSADSGNSNTDAGTNPYQGAKDSGTLSSTDSGSSSGKDSGTTSAQDSGTTTSKDSGTTTTSNDCTGSTGEQIGESYSSECNDQYNAFLEYDCTPGGNDCASVNIDGYTFCCYAPTSGKCYNDYGTPQCVPQ